MKKLLFLLLTTTLIIVNFLSIKQFEFIQFQNFNYQNSNEKWNILIEEGNPNKSKFENFQLLEEAAEEAKVNLQRVSYEKNTKNEDSIVYYVTLYDASKYFKNLKLTSGQFLNENSDPEDFLSTEKTNNKHQIGQLEIFHSFDPIEIRPMIVAEKTKDIKGTYTSVGTEQTNNLKRIASEKGLSIKLSMEQSQRLMTKYPYQQMMYIGMLILCLLIMLALLYDISNNFKEIAVRYMFGYNFGQIGSYLLRKYIKIFLFSLLTAILALLLFLYFYNQYQQFFEFIYFWMNNIFLLLTILSLIFIITWLGTKNINIPQMIKNKKPIKVFFYLNIIVRFVLAVFLLLGLQQGISTFQSLKKTISQQEKWSLLKDYSYLGVVSATGQEVVSFQNDKDMRKNFRLLYKELESQGAFYISPSNYYLNKDSSLNSDPLGMNGRKVEINKNYLAVNPIKDIQDKNVEIPRQNKNEITVLVPMQFKKNEMNIKNSISKDYEGIFNIKDPKPVDVNIIYVKNNQSYFTYYANMAQNNNYEINDPIAIIVNYEFDPVILFNTISMGYGYYTKNSENKDPFEMTKNTLKKYDLNDIWQPISVAYSNVELKIANDTEALQLNLIYCGLLIILAAILLFFSAIYYLEMNKQSLALQWIFGYNFFEKHSLVYLSILVFWNLAFMICFFIADNIILLVKITAWLIIFDFLLTSILLIIKEYNITKQVLIEK